ncbi:hypothetical protein OF829_05130 [Sphingomonas sp. LB-2]|uniref:hypothetical protein n=1 Tax=Sphingomonas caeni TaxID=2984949 RepID=UPI002230F61D|nr:hypothetical protein [Sphingomonas caeni]MCW3846612.1 hypothetical protein [Sphingomonas caeni]
MKQLVQFLLPMACALSASPALAQGWDAPPRPPAGAAPNLQIPQRDAFGHYQTINQGLTPAETSWHVRAALNVAALGCRGAGDGELVPQYNRLIAAERGPLAAADASVKAQYRKRYGAGWQEPYDRDMTRLYNFFAQPPAQPGFCAAARGVLGESLMLEPGEYEAFAAWALPLLEAPFTDFYTDYEAWRTADAAWRQGRYGTVASASAPLP